MIRIENLSRRGFLRGGLFAGAALILGCSSSDPKEPVKVGEPASFAPSAFLRIDAKDRVTLWLTKPEMGQGVHTSLPMLVAEELSVEWSAVSFERAPFDEKYGEQNVIGSTSIRHSFLPLRQAGAAARAMLITAAAAAWKVAEEECRADKGAVIHTPTDRRLRYGELVEAAAKLPVPSEVRLKDPSEFQIIGTRVPRVDSPSKVDGSAGFGLDTVVRGMLYASVVHCPVFGGKLATVDDTEARKVAGVSRVEKLPTAVAVIADNTWAAMQGCNALKITWEEGSAATLSSAEIRASLDAAATQAAVPAIVMGDAEAALAGALQQLTATYETPFLAHAAMEPVNCVADVREGFCELWVSGQVPQFYRDAIAGVTGIAKENIRINMTYLGGGFGRRAEVDFVIEAVMLSKAIGAPVKVTWTREEDIQHDAYRPVSMHKLRAGLDATGKLVAWTHRVIAPSFFAQRGLPLDNGMDRLVAESLEGVPFAPAVQVDYVMANTAVTAGVWRSVYNSQSAFANECFLDELAAAAGKDPVELRRELLSASPRHVGVLDLAAGKAGWGTPLPQGRGRGVAVHKSFDTYVAQVAEVTVSATGVVKVDRVVCAVDCGIAVNPATVEAQIQSAVIYGLSAALKGEITIDKGRVMQSNFHDYEVLRMDDAPVIEVYIVPSTESPGGMGEPGLPPVGPAVVNAVFAATGKRVRHLPLRAEDLM